MPRTDLARPRRTLCSAAPLALAATLAAAALAALPAPVQAGPPWISVELPANPHHPDTRGALALVHTFHHGDSRQFPVRGEAIGFVDGVRRTVALDVTPTYRPGVWAVRGTLPNGSGWVLNLLMTDGDKKPLASALVALRGDGEVFGVRVPHDLMDGWKVPREATNAEVESMLRGVVALSVDDGPSGRAGAAMAAGEAVGGTSSTVAGGAGTVSLAGLGLLLLGAVGSLAVGRRRERGDRRAEP